MVLDTVKEIMQKPSGARMAILLLPWSATASEPSANSAIAFVTLHSPAPDPAHPSTITTHPFYQSTPRERYLCRPLLRHSHIQ